MRILRTTFNVNLNRIRGKEKKKKTLKKHKKKAVKKMKTIRLTPLTEQELINESEESEIYVPVNSFVVGNQMEGTGCKIIRVAQTTLAVKG